eukprot:m.91673 g.91673  ORF g.91673 m.91673 type:complete len:1128 (+) comp9918_c0_seq1:89-3472(+)
MSADMSLGARVRHKTGIGTLRFIGGTDFSDGVWCGVQLDEAKGKNDGAVNGIQYFQCENLHGLFARPDKLELLDEPKRTVEAPLYPTYAMWEQKLRDAEAKLSDRATSAVDALPPMNGSGGNNDEAHAEEVAGYLSEIRQLKSDVADLKTQMEKNDANATTAATHAAEQLTAAQTEVATHREAAAEAKREAETALQALAEARASLAAADDRANTEQERARAAEGARDKAVDETATLRRQLDELKAVHDAMKAHMTELESDRGNAGQLQSALAKARADLEVEQHAVQAANDKLASMTSQRDAAAQEHANALQRLSDELAATKADMASMQTRLAEQQAAHEAAEKTALDTKNDLAALQTELTSTKEQLVNAKSAAQSTASEALQAAQSEADVSRGRADSALAALAKLKNECEAARQEAARQTERADSAEAARQTVEEKLAAAYDKARDEQTAAESRTSAALAQVQAEKKAQDEHVARLQDEVKKQNDATKALKEAVAKAESQLSQAASEANSTTQDLQQQLETLQGENASLQEAMKISASEVEQAEKKIERLNAQLKELNQVNTTLQDQVSHLETVAAASAAEAEKARSHLDSIAGNAQSERQSVESTLAQHEKVVNQLKQDLNSSEQQLKKAQMEVKRLTEDAEVLNAKCRQEEQRAFDAEAKVKSLHNTMEVRVKDMQTMGAMQERDAEALREKLSAAEKKIAELETERLQLIEETKNTSASAADHNDMIGQQIAALKEAAKLAHTEASKARAEASKATEDAASDRLRCTQEKERAQIFQKQYLEAQTKIEAAEERSKRDAAKLQVSEEYVTALSDQLNTTKSELATLKDELAQAQGKAKDLEVAKRQGEVFQGELLANIEKAAASSKSFIANMRTKHAAEKKSLQDQIDELKAQVKTATKEAVEHKAAFEALAVQEAKWSSERQDLLERSNSLDQTQGYLSETTEHISYLKSKIEFLQESLEDAKQSLEPFVQKGLVPALRTVRINPAVKEASGRLGVDIPKVISAEDESGSYKAYEIVITAGEDTWKVYRRYSQLLALHTSILQKTSLTPEELAFPPKVTFGAKSDRVVEERRLAFIQYLQRILNLASRDPSTPLASNPSKATLLAKMPFFGEEEIAMGTIEMDD